MDNNDNTPPARGRGRGFPRPRQPGHPGPGTNPTPVAGHTRGQGFRNFIELDKHGRPRTAQWRAAHQPPQDMDGGDATQHTNNTAHEEGGDIHERMAMEDTERLQRETSKFREDIEYYYNRRVTLYLERADEDGDVVKSGLSAASLEALRKTLETINHFHQRADENFQILRHSPWFSDDDITAHEIWYNKVNTSMISLLDQVREQERNIATNTTAPTDSLHSPSFMTPFASSERYTPSVIEPLKLDNFNGTKGTFRTFRSRFNLVMKKSRIDEGLQAEHLLQHLDGEPLRIAMMVDLEDSEALSHMWFKLNQAFGNEQCDYQHHVAELQKLGTYGQCRTDADLKELYYSFTEHIQALRRISKNSEDGEAYKTTLCTALPEYLKKKVLKILSETPQNYTLDNIMKLVSKQVDLCNMQSIFSSKDHHTQSGRDNSSPWARSRVESERRARTCAGKLEMPYLQHQDASSGEYSNKVSSNFVTIGHETFNVPGPVARACYPVARPQTNHYAFAASMEVPPITHYITDSTPNTASVNTVKSTFSKGAGAQTNQTLKLDLTKLSLSCVFCNGNHGPLDCRAFELGNQYIAHLKNNNRCYNCFSQEHVLECCQVDSTCKAPACKFTIRHCPFFCGHFKKQTRSGYFGSIAYTVDAKGQFENTRMHTVLFMLVNPATGHETLVRGYLDSGCTDTFILNQSAVRSDLPGRDASVRYLLSSFTEELVEGKGSVVNAIFKSVDGKYVSPVFSCITKDKLIRDVESFKLSSQQVDIINQSHYTLSDISSLETGTLPVDVVIGMDIYYQFIRGAPVHISDGLVLVDTVFGHTLGGPVKDRAVQRTPNMNYLKVTLVKESCIPERCIPEGKPCLVGRDSSSCPCLFCGGPHEPEDCTIFTSREQVTQVLEAQSLCFNCLDSDHIAYFCDKPSSCQRSQCKRRGKHSGIMCKGFKVNSPNCAVNTFKLSVDEEQTSLKRLTDLETLGIKEDEKEESPLLEQFNSEVRKDKVENRVVIKLPWQHKRKKRLRSNFRHAFDRANKLYDKLSKPTRKEEFDKYDGIMQEQVKLGILEEVADIGTITEVEEKLTSDPYHYDHLLPCHEDSQICYIPHSGHIKPTSGKLRVVYDASDKPFKGAFSLNECLETGPSLIKSLHDILTRFRLKRYGYMADISNAFLQIVVDPCDRDSLRLLWRKGDHVIIYRFTRLPFGLTSSPFVLAATLKFLLETSTLKPVEIQTILQSFYVDDLVGSKDSEEEVRREKEKVEETLGEGSMPMHKWNSNSVVLKGLFAGDDSVPDEEMVLGMVWDTLSDTLHINNKRIIKNISNRNTKEELYSMIAQVFDPMGLLSPYVFVAKRLLQKACLAKIGWKDKLPSELIVEWEAWKAGLPGISDVKFERWVSFEGAEQFELHGFCDASGDGLAACVYLVSKGKGRVMSRLLRCRTRVNSTKHMSMPRRELCATVLLSLVMYTVAEAVKELNITNKVYYTDSMNALHWLTSDHYDWPPYICNRIKQVRALTDTKQWRYVNTTQNPADLPSRGCTTETLREHTLYKEGPHFLITGEPPFLGKMDSSAMPEGCLRELPKVALAAAVGNVEPRINLRALISTSETNSYYKLMKTTKLVYKAVTLMRAKSVPVDSQSWGIKRLELDWARSIQHDTFEKEITYCKRPDKDQTRPPLVKSLSLDWDTESQLLRCSTRLQEAHIGYAASNPILLPRDDDFTTMLVTAVHQRVGHVGVKQTLSSLRSEYWVPQARRLVKKLINRCIICRRVSASPYDLPPPPPLPKCRVAMSRPFSNLGIDFCGPFSLKRQAKWYVAVFTCAVTRAVHFETLRDLSAESFLLALKRFIGRRGVPELIISDNAKTFKCVAKRLKRVFDNPALQRYLMERRVRWHFYVERAPWHGGFIETCVKLFKGVFKKLVGHSKLNSEEFRTLVVEAEQVVNSRPLTYLYEDRKEGEPLTPSKMLHGYNLTDLPPIGRGGLSEKLSITKRAKLLERLQNRFWEEWSETYLNELAERHFSQKVGNNDIREPQEGEVVLLRGEPRMPRNRWKVGVIEKVHRSFKGNRIRSVIVRIPKGKGYDGGEFRRSPKHVVPLEAQLD